MSYEPDDAFSERLRKLAGLDFAAFLTCVLYISPTAIH